MHHWKTAILTLVIFGLGSIAGGLVTARVIRAKIEAVKQTQAGPESTMPDWIPQSIALMERHLNLSPAQAKDIRDTMLRAQKEILHAREDWRLTSRGAMARADDAVLALLNPEQKEKFGDYKKKRRQLLQQRLQGSTPARPGERLDQLRENFPRLRERIEESK